MIVIVGIYLYGQIQVHFMWLFLFAPLFAQFNAPTSDVQALYVVTVISGVLASSITVIVIQQVGRYFTDNPNPNNMFHQLLIRLGWLGIEENI